MKRVLALSLAVLLVSLSRIGSTATVDAFESGELTVGQDRQLC
jgi:hypothetical protein